MRASRTFPWGIQTQSREEEVNQLRMCGDRSGIRIGELYRIGMEDGRMDGAQCGIVEDRAAEIGKGVGM